jgi:hypothetical protein
MKAGSKPGHDGVNYNTFLQSYGLGIVMRKIGMGKNVEAIKGEGQRGGTLNSSSGLRGGARTIFIESAPSGLVRLSQPPCQTLMAQHLNKTTIAA